LKEVSGWARGRCASFGTPCYGRGIVTEAAGSEVSEWYGGGEDVVMGDSPFELEVAVGDRTFGIVIGDDGGLDVLRKLLAPQGGSC
jgi:hypothetical protein